MKRLSLYILLTALASVFSLYLCFTTLNLLFYVVFYITLVLMMKLHSKIKILKN